MKTRCPCCGALSSLDALIANDRASDALAVVFRLSGKLGKAWIQYLGLFRPEKNQLSFERVANLTLECIRDIESQRIMRDGKPYNAPIDAWLFAIEEMLKMRNLGKLRTPLNSHGYLYDVITSYVPKAEVIEKQDPKVTQGLNMMAKGLLGNATKTDIPK